MEAPSRAVGAEGLLPRAWPSLLEALAPLAIAATIVSSLTAIEKWLNYNIKKSMYKPRCGVGVRKGETQLRGTFEKKEKSDSEKL